MPAPPAGTPLPPARIGNPSLDALPYNWESRRPDNANCPMRSVAHLCNLALSAQRPPLLPRAAIQVRLSPRACGGAGRNFSPAGPSARPRPPSVDVHAAVDVDALAGDVGARGGAEEEDDAGDLLRRGRAVERDERLDLAVV